MTLRTITRIGTIYAIAPSFQVQKLTQCGNDQLSVRLNNNMLMKKLILANLKRVFTTNRKTNKSKFI